MGHSCAQDLMVGVENYSFICVLEDGIHIL